MRGATTALLGNATTLARPLAFAGFARTAGADALGAFLVIWTTAELGARIATLGLDLGLRRWARDDRGPAIAAALVLAGGLGALVAVATAAVLPWLVPLDPETLAAARATIAIAVPLIAMGNVALRAPRGTAQIASYVLARNVVEPIALLVVGLAASALAPGAIPLLAAYAVSIAAGALVAARTLVRALGAAALAQAVRTPAAWPVRSLLGQSIPLGAADLLQNAQTKLDLVIVALVTFSPAQIASYAIAAELVSALSNLRQSFDQVLAPLAAELRGQRPALADLLATGMRWSALVAVPLAAGLVLFARPLLAVFGGAPAAAPVLIALVAGRVIEMIAGPGQSILAVISRPWLALVDAAFGVTVALLAQVALAGSGPLGIAIGSSLGVASAALLSLVWLARVEGVRLPLPTLSLQKKLQPIASVVTPS